jgi:hypothetical protein
VRALLRETIPTASFARLRDATDRRHSVIVFRQPVKPGRTALEVAELVQPSLANSGFTDVEITESTMADRPAALLHCARHAAGRTWAVREYLFVDGRISFCLGCGSAVPNEDDALFTSMADGFELL